MTTFTFRRASWLRDAVYVESEMIWLVSLIAVISFQLLYIFIYKVRLHYPPVGVTFPVHCVFC
jgi:hypothetical protein